MLQAFKTCFCNAGYGSFRKRRAQAEHAGDIAYLLSSAISNGLNHKKEKDEEATWMEGKIFNQ